MPLVAFYGRLYKVTCAWLIFSFVLRLRHTLCKYALIEAKIPKLQPGTVFSVFEIGVAQIKRGIFKNSRGAGVCICYLAPEEEI